MSSHRVDKIKGIVSLEEVLLAYNYGIREGGGNREQQFSCDLHGDGEDLKKSARFYPETNTWYCFACEKVRDVISTVMEKENISFLDACRFLEKAYDIPYTPGSNTRKEPEPSSASSEFDFESERHQTERFLSVYTEQKKFSLLQAASLWETYDLTCYWHTKKEWSPKKASLTMRKVRAKAIEIISRGLS